MSFFKSKLNIWLLVSFLIAGILSLWLYMKLTTEVGDIHYDSSVDSKDFSPCGRYKIYQYFRVGTFYKGGEKMIKNTIMSSIKMDGLPDNGLLTVRFIVNCKGESGFYRTKMVDNDLKEVKVPNSISSHLYSLISELDGWVPGKINGESMDSYAQIVFKVQNGKVTDIF